eukprot:2425695-Prymnesium_polylepis.2
MRRSPVPRREPGRSGRTQPGRAQTPSWAASWLPIDVAGSKSVATSLIGIASSGKFGRAAHSP